MDSSKKIIDKIKAENIQPIPRWRFRLKNITLWLVFALAVLLGALAFSVVLFSIQQIDFNLATHLTHSKLELFLGLLPFLWIILLIIFLLMAIFSIQNSKKGYKFTRFRWVGISTALSILIGTLFFIGGGASQLEDAFATKLGFYEGIQEKKEKIWMNPDKGLLAGTIERVDGNILFIEDLRGQKWEVVFEDAFIPRAVSLEQAEKVKFIGEIISDQKFKAEEIRPWGGPEMRIRGKGSRNKK